MRFKHNHTWAVRSWLTVIGAIFVGIAGLIWFRQVRLLPPRLNLMSEIQTHHALVAGYIVIESIAFSADGSLIASGGRDGSIQISNAQTLKPLHSLKSSQEPVTRIAFDTKSDKLAVGKLSSLMIWDIRTDIKTSSFGLFSLCDSNAFLLKNTNVFARSGTKVGVLNYKSNKFNKIIEISDTTRHLAVSPDFTTLVAASWPEKVTLYNLRTAKMLRNLVAPIHKASGGIPWTTTCLIFSSDNRTVIVGGGKRGVQGLLQQENNGYIQIWNVKTGTLVRTVTGRTNIICLAVSPDGRLLASADEDGEVVVRNTSSWQIEGTYATDVYGIRTLAFSPNSQILTGAGQGNKLRLWKINSLTTP